MTMKSEVGLGAVGMKTLSGFKSLMKTKLPQLSFFIPPLAMK
jgi:hypothetical protein